MNIHRISDDVTVLADNLEVPGIGFLPVNAFVLHAEQPVVVDTGLGLPDRDFIAALSGAIEPEQVRWIWLTHPDRDHTGGIFALLEAAPQARVVTTFISAGLMSTERPLPLDRIYLVNPGQTFDVGDRVLHAFRPPLFDSPATMGFYDEKSGTLFSSDCFGAPVANAELAGCADAREIPADQLRGGQLMWATVDSPWVHSVDSGRYLQTVRALQGFGAGTIVSTHLPPAIGLGDQLFEMLGQAPGADPFVGPDQKALEQMLAGFQPVGPG